MLQNNNSTAPQGNSRLLRVNRSRVFRLQPVLVLLLLIFASPGVIENIWAVGLLYQERSDIQVLQVTLRPDGFHPDELTLTAGTYMLIAENRSGLESVSLQVDKEGSGRQGQIRLRHYKVKWRQQVQLTPGTYTVTETDHPDWTCRITVSAN